jgi:hypothetical protein
VQLCHRRPTGRPFATGCGLLSSQPKPSSGGSPGKQPIHNAAACLGGALRLPQCAFCLLVALAAPMAAHADSPPQPIPADGTCAVPVDPSWTKQEQFVWLNACAGKAADFNKEPGYGGDLDPKSPKLLPESRILRSSFLETILLKDKYRSALTRLGVRIVGARITETVDLQNAELEHDLGLERSLLEKDVNLETVETGRRISFDSSRILGTFNAAGSRISEDLSLYQTEFFTDVNLSRTHIGNLLLSGARVAGMLNMYQIHIDQDLFMRDEAQFKEITLGDAHIGGQLDLTSSTVTGMLDMNGFSVGQGLFMRDKANFTEINLVVAHISGLLDLSGSTVTGMLSMNGIRVDQGLFMRDKAHFKDINLVAAHIGGALDLSGSTVAGMLNMNQIHADYAVFMHDKANFKEINLAVAHIGGQLDLSSSTVTGMLDMNGISVDQVLLMREKAQFAAIDLRGARAEQIDLSSSTVTGMLDMSEIHVDQALLMGNQANFTGINLAVAHIGGQLDLNGSTVTGKLNGDYVDVGQTVFLGNSATFTDEIDFRSAKLGQDLDLSEGTFHNNVDLAGTKIGGTLGLKSTQWLGTATLNLAGAAAGGIDLSHSWPDRIFLNEFTYRNLSNISANISQQAEKWFGKQAYAPQPYEQLASVLQANGLIDEATDIRYAGKVREWRASSGLSWAWLFLLNYSIGFGYHLEYAFAWALGFVLLGWAVLYATGQRTKHGMTLGLAYSFDMLLPLVQLDKKHDDVDLDPWPQRYFYAHKIVGVLLASFIAAGISGLTK